MLTRRAIIAGLVAAPLAPLPAAPAKASIALTIRGSASLDPDAVFAELTAAVVDTAPAVQVVNMSATGITLRDIYDDHFGGGGGGGRGL